MFYARGKVWRKLVSFIRLTDTFGKNVLCQHVLLLEESVKFFMPGLFSPPNFAF